MKALAVAIGIVFWTLVLGVAVLAMLPGSQSGEPVAVLQIEQAPAPPPAAEEGGNRPASPGGLDLPPGFAVTGSPAPQPQGPVLAPPGEGTTMMPVAPGNAPPGPQGSPPSDPERQGHVVPAPNDAKSAQASLGASQAPQQAAMTPALQGGEETGSPPMVPVPVAELVEESQYGPLPKVAVDGRRPTDVYARPSPYAARDGPGGAIRVAVLVNGLGVPGAPDDDVIKGLPPPVSVAYGAYGRGLQDLVAKARVDGHEVFLAIPLEPANYPTEDPGPHTLLTTLPTVDNIKRLHWVMSRYTGYVGVTNHMGAKFEAAQDALRPVLEELKQRGLLYLDDGSVPDSATTQIAGTLGLDYSVAHVRLDQGDIAKALADLESAARQQGAAIGVAKAQADTVKKIARWADGLGSKGIVLVPVSAAVRSQRQS
ncbi:MAG: divergent polysaccharide deacetylase family protein [Methyloceanibacter sp.]